LAKADAEKALAQARGGKKLEELYPALKEKMQFEAPTAPEAKATDEFSVNAESAPQLPPMPDLLKDVAAQKGEALLGKVYDSGDGFLVARVDSRTIPSDAAFTQQLPKLRETTLQTKQREAQESFVKALRKGAKINVSKDVVAGALPGEGEPEG
ncbi:MAG TPA: peptidylprolyl isomerase, partial [Myxococcales bacterium]|nr:peptidylprolyl isomerase [Myxococcales bacterium]